MTLQSGILASNCENDDDYLNKAEALIKGWLIEDDMFDLIDDNFFGEAVNEKAFRKTLNKILTNIVEIRKTPVEQREFEDWG